MAIYGPYMAIYGSYMSIYGPYMVQGCWPPPPRVRCAQLHFDGHPPPVGALQLSRTFPPSPLGDVCSGLYCAKAACALASAGLHPGERTHGGGTRNPAPWDSLKRERTPGGGSRNPEPQSIYGPYMDIYAHIWPLVHIWPYMDHWQQGFLPWP